MEAFADASSLFNMRYFLQVLLTERHIEEEHEASRWPTIDRMHVCSEIHAADDDDGQPGYRLVLLQFIE